MRSRVLETLILEEPGYAPPDVESLVLSGAAHILSKDT